MMHTLYCKTGQNKGWLVMDSSKYNIRSKKGLTGLSLQKSIEADFGLKMRHSNAAQGALLHEGDGGAT